MKYPTTRTSALLALCVSAGLAAAQTTATPDYSSTVTTGIVGWAPTTQTAQLNVLNLEILSAVAGTTTPNPSSTCPVELEFHDAQNNVLKSVQVSNVAPGTAASLTLRLFDLTASSGAIRAGIRGVVKFNPANGGIANPPAGVALPNIVAFCSLMPTLELFDNATGVTQMFTSDSRNQGPPLIVPLTSVH